MNRSAGRSSHRRNRARKPVRATEQGMTLVEVLVTIVVLSVGLLGLAGLQLRGIQVNQGAAMRSQAAILAEDLADRMRGDYAAFTSGSFFNAWTPAKVGATPTVSLNDWLYSLSALPAGPASSQITDGCASQPLPCANIQTLAKPAGTILTPVQIDIYWNDARAAGASTPGSSVPGAVVSANASLGHFTTVAEFTDTF